ncbi:tyrosine-type recombinase/integrase [Virgibacillus soli]|uniref:Tyrosine-type recombinase/integrase n=1 Tax=Paracerasibacillus soli TaxID=480284 RepID=A0ABU5CVU9_9BACI|nr:tyrosine-type recombinase/integrase [Virgibacillus soli]MDY0409949.1 tyrosine-type recombinase/integrase [Virgibacillus soli]
MSKRKGKPIIRTRSAPSLSANNSVDLSLHDALDFVYSTKQAEGLRPRTLSEYRSLFGLFIEWLGVHNPGVKRITDISTGMIREYVIYLSTKHTNKKTGEIGLSPYTVNIRIRLLKAFFNTLHTEEIIDKNPAQAIKLMRVDEDTFEPLTDEEVNRLLSVPDIRLYAQFRDLVSMFLILDTGIRSSEMFALEMEDVNFKSRAIYLPGSKTKNRKPRILPLSNQVLRMLMELITEVKANFETTYIFVSNFGERYSPSSFRRRLHIYKERSGIDKSISAHGLRHQFCRDYIMNGGDIFTLQRIAGHADISTTRKYIQLTDEDLKTKHAEFSPIARRRIKYRK